MNKTIFYCIPLFFIVLLFTACNSSKNTEPNTAGDTLSATDSLLIKNPDTKKENDSERPPIINLTDGVSRKSIVLVMKDSSSTYERIGGKLGNIFLAKLGGIIKKNKINITGAPMVWYNTNKAPYFFEAGVPIDKKPAKLPKQAAIKYLEKDSVVIAHFYGPYSLLPQAYEAAKLYIASKKKKITGKPYEIYVDDPMGPDGKPNDPYKVLTDVVFPVN